MNAGIITTIKYKVDGDSSYTTLSYTFFSGTFTCEVQKSAAGNSYHTKLNVKVPKTGKTNSDTLSALVGKKLIIQFVDGNGRTHTVGTTNYPAHLTFTASVMGEAGSWNGYDITITNESPSGYTIADS